MPKHCYVVESKMLKSVRFKVMMISLQSRDSVKEDKARYGQMLNTSAQC